MNLFVTDQNPVSCAQNLDDKRVGKMLMETNQMLTLAIKLNMSYPLWEDHVGLGKLCMGFAHQNHPVSIWVRANQANFNWSMCHAFALGEEWELRFNKPHGSFERTLFIKRFLETKDSCLPSGDLLPFQNSAKNAGLDIDYSHLPVPHSYRMYLKTRWHRDSRPPVWTGREPPIWWTS